MAKPPPEKPEDDDRPSTQLRSHGNVPVVGGDVVGCSVGEIIDTQRNSRDFFEEAQAVLDEFFAAGLLPSPDYVEGIERTSVGLRVLFSLLPPLAFHFEFESGQSFRASFMPAMQRMIDEGGFAREMATSKVTKTQRPKKRGKK